MLVKTLKAHQNSYGNTYEKEIGDEYDHPRPDADILFGNVGSMATDEDIIATKKLVDAALSAKKASDAAAAEKASKAEAQKASDAAAAEKAAKVEAKKALDAAKTDKPDA